MIALLFLLSVNGHYVLIDGLMTSYQFIPLEGLLSSDGAFSAFIILSFNSMFAIEFQMTLSIGGCLFLVDVALGLIARTVPQVNVFVVGLPLKILVSFLVISLFLSLYIMLSKFIFETIFETMRDLMQLLGGG